MKIRGYTNDNKVVFACDNDICESCKKFTNPYYYDYYDYCTLHCCVCNTMEFNKNIDFIKRSDKVYLVCKNCFNIYKKRIKQIFYY